MRRVFPAFSVHDLNALRLSSAARRLCMEKMYHGETVFNCDPIQFGPKLSLPRR